MEVRRLGFFRKLLYSSGTAGYSTLEMLILTYLAYYTLPPAEAHLPQLIPEKLFGLLPMLGIIMLFGRVLDSITDPIIANLSDGAKFKRGRRIPFMLFSVLPFVLSAVFLFQPIYQTKTAWNSLYLIALLSVYFVSYTADVIPYSGLLPEITRTDRERLNLTMMQGVLGVFGIALGLVVFPHLASRIRYTNVIGLFGLISAVFLLLPVFAIDERKHCISKPSSFKIHEAIKAAIDNRPFMIYLLSYLSFRLGFNMIVMSVPYYVKVLLKQDQAAQASYFGISFLACQGGFFIANGLGKRKGKKAALLWAMLFAVIFMPGLAFLGKINLAWADMDTVFVGLGRADIYALVIMGILGIPMAALYVIPNAIVADLTDLEKARSGQNLEAVYYGVQGFFTKFIIGLSFLFVTGLFTLFGRGAESGSDLGIRLTGPLAAIFIFIGYLFLREYPEKVVFEEKEPEHNIKQKGKKRFWRRRVD